MIRHRALAIAAGIALGAVAIAAAVALASQVANPGSPSAHSHRNVTASEQTHDTGGPYISRDGAIHVALTLKGETVSGKTVVSAVLETRGAADVDLGYTSTSEATGTDRQVWVVKVHGPYVPSFQAPPGATPVPVANHFAVVIDATTGQILQVASTPKDNW